MRKLFVLFLLGLCVCLVSGCCNCNGTGTTPDEPDTPEPPTNSVTYLTRRGSIEVYVTAQPIQGVNDYTWFEPGTGEYSSSGYYLGHMETIEYPYVTKWSDSSVTFSVDPYEGVDYTIYTENTEFNDTSFVSSGGESDETNGTEPDILSIGTAPSGRTASDYTYDANRREYVYNGGNSNTNTQQVAPSASPSALLNEDSDDEDVNGNVSENDGRNLNTGR
jgi:hypothetical protein